MADEQFPRRPTMSYEAELVSPDRTRLAIELKAAVIVAGALLAAGVTAGMTYLRLDTRIERLEERVIQASTKADIERIQVTTRNQVTSMVNKSVRKFLVKCPRDALRAGTRDVVCPAVLLREEERDVE